MEYVNIEMTKFDEISVLVNELLHEKTNNLGFRPGLTQTDLYKHRSSQET